MRITRSFAIWFALCLALVSSALAATDRERLQTFMEVTGFDVSLISMRLSARSAPQMLGISEESFGLQWTRLADETFEPEEIQREALQLLSQTLRPEAREHVVAFYASPLGLRLVAAENASHMTEDSIKDTQGEAEVVRLIQENPERIELYRELSAAVGSEDTAIRTIRELQVRFIMAAMAAGITERQMSEADLRGIFASQDQELRESIRTNAIAANAYTYREFSDEEILAYIEALKEPLMQEVYELMSVVQFIIMVHRYEELATEMAKLTPSEAL